MPDTDGSTSNNKLEKYGGETSDIRIQTWLRLFEVHSENRGITTEKDKINALIYSLKGTALEWFGDEIAGSTITRWDTVKTKITKRFGISTATPLIDAQRRYLRRDETIEIYFREKMRLLRQTKLSEAEIVQQLSEGCPMGWKMSLAAAHLSDPNSWIEVAQQLESHQKQQFQRQQFRDRNPQQRPKPQTGRTLNACTTRPYQPCRFCQEKGREEYHWHRECPLRQQNQSNSFNRNRPSNNYANNRPNNRHSAHTNTAEELESSPSEVTLN